MLGELKQKNECVSHAVGQKETQGNRLGQMHDSSLAYISKYCIFIRLLIYILSRQVRCSGSCGGMNSILYRQIKG